MRAVLTTLLGLLLAGCRGEGAEGFPPPGVLDLAAVAHGGGSNSALAAPAGFHPAPDIVTRRYAVPPARLFAAIREAAEAQPRVFPHAAQPERMQAHYVARSAVFNFPDLVTVQVNPDSTLVIWSRSVYGRSDFGVNARRVRLWLAALDTRLAD